MSGQNLKLDWQDTYAKEGRDPDSVFLVHVPGEANFDKAVQNRTARNTWDWHPSGKNQTNCVEASRSRSGCGIKVKGSGRGRPLYTNNAFTPPGAGPSLSHVRIIIVMPRTDAS